MSDEQWWRGIDFRDVLTRLDDFCPCGCVWTRQEGCECKCHEPQQHPLDLDMLREAQKRAEDQP